MTIANPQPRSLSSHASLPFQGFDQPQSPEWWILPQVCGMATFIRSLPSPAVHDTQAMHQLPRGIPDMLLSGRLAILASCRGSN